MAARDLRTVLLLLAACAPEPGDATATDTTGATAGATSGPSVPTGDGPDAPPVNMCGAVAPTCGPAPCVLRSQVDLWDPTRQTSQRPTLVVGQNCQPHALLLADLHEPWTFIPFYVTTRDGVMWTGEVAPIDAITGSLFLDPVDETPVIVGELKADFTSTERRDGVWQPAGFTGPSQVKGAVRTLDGITHVLTSVLLHRFDSGGAEVETLSIGGEKSGWLTRLMIDRGGTVLQTTFFDPPEPGKLPDAHWWSDGHAVEPIGLNYVEAHAASGDSEQPGATMLGLLGQDLWLAWRRGDGVWSRRFVTTRADYDNNYPEDPVDGQVFIRHG